MQAMVIAMIGEVPLGVLMVEVTRRCPRRCAFCYVRPDADGLPGSGDELGAEELARLAVTVARAEGCAKVQLSGGEPLLRPDLLDLVDRLRAADLAVSLLTEGAGLDAATARALASRGVGPVQPTVLSGSAATHDALRGPGAFRVATRAIAEGAAAQLEMSVSFVITRENWQEAAATAELAFALGARTFALSRFCPAGTARDAADRLLPSPDQVRRAAEDAAGTCRALGLAVAAAITVPACVWSDPAHPPVPTGVCSLMGDRTTATLGPDGSVRSCSLSRHPVGNLRDEPWEVLARRLWDRDLRPLREVIPSVCRTCAQWTRCRAGCRLSAPGEDPAQLDALAPVPCPR